MLALTSSESDMSLMLKTPLLVIERPRSSNGAVYLELLSKSPELIAVETVCHNPQVTRFAGVNGSNRESSSEQMYVQFVIVPFIVQFSNAGSSGLTVKPSRKEIHAFIEESYNWLDML